MADSIHRLEGLSNQVGGLVVKKKLNSDPDFKAPPSRSSVLGLDVLAAQKRKLKDVSEREVEEEKSRRSKVTSYRDEWENDSDSESDDSNDSDEEDTKSRKKRKHTILKRHYRAPHLETPSHTGGVSSEAMERQQRREKESRKGVVYASSNNDDRKGRGSREWYERDKYRDRDRGGGRHREKYKELDRNRDRNRRDRPHDRRADRRDSERGSRSDRSDRSVRSNWERTPRADDDLLTPRISRGIETPSRTSWEEEDDVPKKAPSQWDQPTPKMSSQHNDLSERRDRSERGDRKDRSSRKDGDRSRHRRKEDETPMLTPAHRYNSWASNRKKSGATPQVKGGDTVTRFKSEEEQELWEEEQKKIDRQWYGSDEGYDESNNPFAAVPVEYAEKKERDLATQKAKRISAQQRQINKDNDKWETNRLLTSGVVQQIEYEDVVDEETVNRVHLLVHNIVPPFLDGRIVFTKQPEPVIPVKDNTSDMAQIARKGSNVVKKHREQKERKKAQHKHWELAGTKLGDIMGVKKEDEKGTEEENINYKSQQQFADHMKEKTEASSAFAKQKSIREQREYLPVFAVRQVLLNVIRDNSVVIIVGETGSGKTTQLTQVGYITDPGGVLIH
ncbi:pre-mRNA-splicing factor ATP-dependent RNA helicase PRP16-like [Lytechinus variegatus]|uniref:pre-mRNA-splicing factor ATP-dependent RNA helicase PRP16-like n=1 Tax=Lytechinus variegatus TaxID=7654 RepID=UPI001BB1E8DA|nr:pre-mRNA-splicing factor ATP-dependent RNA helicase PRP16-like [Lytechinus variegatus]